MPGSAASSEASSGGRGSSYFLAGAFLLAMGGGWLLIRRRGVPLSRVIPGRRGLIRIEETKSLGNRQYLVVAGCEGRRFLLGVAPGRIQMLTPLDDADDPSETPAES